jgi:quinol monooxygenase YgiN
MYGTIARMQVKPGMEEQFMEFGREMESVDLPGFIASYVYRTDAYPNVFYLVVVTESREAYFANAQRPGQHEMYLKMRAMLTADPEWHDGEIVQARNLQGG